MQGLHRRLREINKLYKTDPEKAHSLEDEILWEFVQEAAIYRDVGGDGSLYKRLST